MVSAARPDPSVQIETNKVNAKFVIIILATKFFLFHFDIIFHINYFYLF